MSELLFIGFGIVVFCFTFIGIKSSVLYWQATKPIRVWKKVIRSKKRKIAALQKYLSYAKIEWDDMEYIGQNAREHIDLDKCKDLDKYFAIYKKNTIDTIEEIVELEKQLMNIKMEDI